MSPPNLPWKDAIIEVLKDAHESLSPSEIAQAVAERELRKDLGATPAATVGAKI